MCSNNICNHYQTKAGILSVRGVASMISRGHGGRPPGGAKYKRQPLVVC